MATYLRCSCVAVFCLLLAAKTESARAQTDAPLPEGVKVVWDLAKAWREATPTRERICINGLWRWQPAKSGDSTIPATNWGYFKVPGAWPGVTDYMQKDCQMVFAHPAWKGTSLRSVGAAWYQREISIPAQWEGRRIVLRAEYLNSFAVVYIDGNEAGELRFPGGDVDITSVCRPGTAHVLSLHVAAMPLKAVVLSYTDSAAAREVQGSVARRGLCGDVYLVSTPDRARITDVKISTSVRKWEMAFSAALEGLASDAHYRLRAQIKDGGRVVREMTSRPFGAGDLIEGRFAFTESWKPEKLWDIHTPQNQYEIQVSLLEAEGGKTLDSAFPERIGFREFWIEGRDFYLNGTRIYLSAVPFDNAQVGAAWATYEAAKESLRRLQSFGINFVYTHNYGCQPGSHLSFAEILRAADDVGMLVSFSQPHFSHYDWKLPDADANNGYARHAEFYVRAAQNHPSVVCYSMNHNSTGYNEDMNPFMIDGITDPRDTWASNNVKLALRTEAIVRRFDTDRIIYHHASGNLGSMHVSNFYVNFVPIQEMSDWLEHWATRGVKPFFTCEYGVPFTWDWTMYRGWYQGKREFGSARVPWEFCHAEWNAQFLGDEAFQIGEPEKANLRWEAKQFRAGRTWYRWDYPYEVGTRDLTDRYKVFARYITDNWRAFRTWGMSANSPWEHGHFWKLRDGMDRNRREELKTDWDNLQRPGFSADYIEQRYERMDLAYKTTDWVATPAAQALIRNNQPLLAYIAGKPAAFTSKDQNFRAGETVEKQIIVINNSREAVTCDCDWSFGLPKAVLGNKRLTLPTGQQQRIPLRFDLPAGLAAGSYNLRMRATFGTGEIQTDSFTVHVLPEPPALKSSSRMALFDPKGETAELFKKLGISYESITARADLANYDLLVIGKGALTVNEPGPDVSRVRDGLKVVVFEQTPEVLEKRFGFRIAEYGLRQVFKRVPDHPILAGLEAEHLRDWRGEATILPPRLTYELSRRFNGAPTVRWCDIEVTRVWRCGCRGNVASVLIEKPARGDFLPVVDGGFSLQYSPLMEYREGKGRVLFCQMDVTGRTESDPAAERLVLNIFSYLSQQSNQPSVGPKVFYIGDPAGKNHLESAGFSVGTYSGEPLSADDVLIVGPGGGQTLSAHAAALAKWLEAGGHLLALGLDEQEANAFLPFKTRMKKAEHIAAFFPPMPARSLLRGIGPADVHNRDPRELPLVEPAGGLSPVGDGVLAEASPNKIVLCQLVPWQFDYAKNYGLKRTFRRASFLLTRLVANMGVAGSTPLLERFREPLDAARAEKRWLNGFYLDSPEEWDDPYRFFRW
ncbi:MAG: hypothetical protein N3D11_08825 [Candidatus Sumerlaeia bacterium]|nr:hypothetical protein [Candidatus Sumerlaeia bacterium]